MDEYTKAALSVIRVVAGGLLLLSLCLYLPDLFLCLSNHPPHFSALVLVGKGIPFVIGVILFWKSKAIAERLTDDLD